MKWLGQYIQSLTARFRSDVYLEDISTGTIASGGNLGLDSNNKIVKTTDLTVYNAVNDGNPTISLGSSATERLEIKAEYESGAQGLDAIRFTTYTAGSTSHDGRFIFEVDDVNTFQIKDSLINIMESGKLTIGNIDILTDSSGTTTLNNIDALDATTISTLNAALTAGDITSVVAGTGLSGGGTSGDVTLNVDVASATDRGIVELATTAETTTGTDTTRAVTPDGLKDGYQGSTNVVTVGTIATGVWNGTAIAHAYIGADAIEVDNIADNQITFAKLRSTAIQTSGEVFADNDTILMTSAAIQDKIQTTLPTKRLHYVHTSAKYTGSGMTSEIYIALADSDRENASELNLAIPLVAPATGVLKRVLVNTQSDLSAKAWTFKFYRVPSGTIASTTTLVATVASDAGGASHTNQVVDFVTNTADSNVLSFESGYSTSTQFGVGDRVLFSTQCTSGSGPSGSPKINYTFVFEVDDSTAY
ncbi:hypothetical protein N9987_00395 [bacterium]|nr:hypothetical protein [bacterium]